MKDTKKNIYLVHTEEILKWMKQSKEGRRPSSTNPKNEEEKRLAVALGNVSSTIKIYKLLKTEEEKRKYRLRHPEIIEIMENMNLIQSNKIYASKSLKRLEKIYKEIENSKEKKIPSTKSINIEENEDARFLQNIKFKFKKPYISSKNKKERIEFLESYPYAPKIIFQLSKIYRKYARQRKTREEALSIQKYLNEDIMYFYEQKAKKEKVENVKVR